jgi:hypothetical protein
MNEISDNIIDMEKEQLKQVIRDLAKLNNLSPSDLAIQAGVAPSTITGFLNNVPGRGHYGLSARTQSKLAEKFPEFKEQIEKPYVSNQQYNMPIIGMWHTDYRVLGLELGMAATFTCNRYEGIENFSAVVRSPDFFKKNLRVNGKINEFSYPNGVKETRYYLFQNIYVNDLEDINSKQVYATTETGNYMGYAVKHKGKFYLHNFYGDRIDIAGEVLKASKIEWTRQV